jgi:drug/metabolite transporter (DMT)-like permease
MSADSDWLRQGASILGLGAFWAVSPILYRFLGEAGVPIVHVIFLTGFGLGLGLGAFHLLSGGAPILRWPNIRFGLGLGVFMNTGFALGLYFAPRVQVSLLNLIVATSPMSTYGVSLLLGREKPDTARIAALFLGLGACALCIFTRPGAAGGGFSWLALASFAIPLTYTVYNLFSAMCWPAGTSPLAAGVAESWASAALFLPLLAVYPPSSAPQSLWAYGLLAAAIVLWLVERLAYFSLIKSVGPVRTVQAVYVATPAGVLLAAWVFKEVIDIWMWISLALVLFSLWLNRFEARTAR